MKLIRPNTINDAVLISSTVPENDHAAWSAVTTYAAGDRVIKAHRIWVSNQSANLNHDPETAGSSWWSNAGPTNRWAMFDSEVGTLTSVNSVLEFVVAPGRFDSLALLAVDANVCTVTMRLGVEVVFERSFSLIDDSAVTDWYQYFFEPIEQQDFILMTGIPVFGEAQTTIRLEKNSGVVTCGVCVFGLMADLGKTLSGAQLGIDDYSRVVFDNFGISTLIKGSFAKNMDVQALIDNTAVDRIHRILSTVRATPVVWIGSEKLSSTVIFGIGSFSIDIKYETKSACSLKIKGMI